MFYREKHTSCGKVKGVDTCGMIEKTKGSLKNMHEANHILESDKNTTKIALDDLIWISDAEKDFNRSREWFLKQIKLQRLRRVKIEGDRKVYLLREEIIHLLQPRILDN